MATITKEFDTYRIFYYSGRIDAAHIYCYKDGACVGRISFFKEGEVIPENSTFENGPDLKFPISRFGDVTGILRHERPLTLHLNLSNLVGLIATGDLEPIGEEEQR
ncbi:MAG: hypothetical protein RBT75_21400 [Anaerolineae bacterium]|nr:hypothetical protein [Anaerolineae bacterium]